MDDVGCTNCGDSGICGSAPDTYYECPECTDGPSHPDDIADDRDPQNWN